MLALYTTRRFLKDVKLANKRGKDLDKLEAIVDLLQNENSLPKKNKDHQLSGNWKNHRECHVEPDWLLIYKTEPEPLILVRTGTYSDLFG